MCYKSLAMRNGRRKGKDRGRKGRVLHTRVPPVLEREIHKLAESLRVPVSNVVRAVLEDAVSVAEQAGRQAGAGLRSWAERLTRERCRDRGSAGGAAAGGGARAARAADPLGGLLGFQPIVLATSAKCGRCGRDLSAGEDAFLGLRDTEGPRLVVGPECVPRAKGGKEAGP